MKLVADSRGRLTAADLFRPNTAFDASRQKDGSIRIVELVEKDVPLVKPIRTKEGFLMCPVKVSRKTIVAAIRAGPRRAMKSYWDSSAIVEAWMDRSLRARLHQERGFTRTHSLAEVFSSLTKGFGFY